MDPKALYRERGFTPSLENGIVAEGHSRVYLDSTVDAFCKTFFLASKQRHKNAIPFFSAGFTPIVDFGIAPTCPRAARRQEAQGTRPMPKFTMGFSIIEILVVVVALSFVSTILFTSFFSANSSQALEKDAAIVAAAFERARSLTLSSSQDQRYGVHVEANRVSVFPGDSYDANNPANRVEVLNPLVTISAHEFAGCGDNVVFKRLTGETDNTGTLTVSLIADPSRFFTISILGTGIIETY